MAAAASSAGDKGDATDRGAYMKCLNAINAMRQRMSGLGASSTIQLPQCVIAGDQSSGKSSLLEAYSGVKLPFGSGTQTRCPTEIDMVPSEGPQRAKLRQFFVEDKEVKEESLIAAIVSAQDQILEKELGKAAEDAADSASRFSATAIRVRAVTEFPQRMTVLDMPGLHAKKEDGSEIVKRMLIERIAGERSLIIAVGEANTDEARHTSFQLARDADAEGSRTIQVFTKCDVTDGKTASALLCQRIGEAAAELAGDGRTAQFAPHFVVARCGGTEDGWSHEGEMDEFRKLGVSSETLKSGVVGVRALRTRTEALLRQLVLTNVPKMLAEVLASRTTAQAELAAIGDEPREASAILRGCVQEIKHTIEQIGRMTNDTTTAFDTVAFKLSKAHAADEKAVRAEVQRRMSPHEIPWFLGRFAFEKQLTTIGHKFGQVLSRHADVLMTQVRHAMIKAIEGACSADTCIRPDFKLQLSAGAAQALDNSAEALKSSFSALAARNSGFYTRNAHYIDDVRLSEAQLNADATVLASVLPASGPITTDVALGALRALNATRRSRSLEDQVVDRVMQDLGRVAQAQLKEFLSAVNAVVKENVVAFLHAWADGLHGDAQLRDLASETPQRLRRRAKLRRIILVANENAAALRDLGVSEVSAPGAAAETGSLGTAAAASGAGAGDAAAASVYGDMEDELPALPEPPRTRAALKADLVAKLDAVMKQQRANRAKLFRSSLGEMAELMAITPAEYPAFVAVVYEVAKPLSGGEDGVTVWYTSKLDNGEPCIQARIGNAAQPAVHYHAAKGRYH